MSENTTIEQVLSDPSSHTVEEVAAAFSQSPAGAVERAKALESEGKGRTGVLDWEPKAAAGEHKFPRARILGAEGAAITGHAAPVLAGALHGDDRKEYTRSQVDQLVQKFQKREVQTAGQEA